MTQDFPPPDRPIVFFDGLCHLCDGFVRFVLDRDPAGIFLFASLQSDFARDFLPRHGLDPETVDTVLLFHRHQFFVRSDAVAEICALLPGVWHQGRHLSRLPKRFRNALYNLVARNRYQLFGRRSHCRIPSPEDRARFIR